MHAARPSDRPLSVLTGARLSERFEDALMRGDGELGAHCVHEWWMRGELSFTVERAVARLWDRAAATIPDWLPMTYVDWLPAVYEIARSFTAGTKGRSNLYLVLLDYRERPGDPFGLYVGMSRHAPAQRFDQHKAGIRAAGSVLKRGLEVLTGPTLHLQNLERAAAARIEIDLAEALAESGLTVKGGH